jgi:hypothetical protein
MTAIRSSVRRFDTSRFDSLTREESELANLNSFAERWVRSVKEECLSNLILFGERSLRRALQQYVVH